MTKRMISLDTNVLFPALEGGHPNHAIAKGFIDGLTQGEVAICELVLLEIYLLVRNPATCRRPLGSAQAGALIHRLRTNPSWRLIDYPGGLMDGVWRVATRPGFARRRIIDVRFAATLLHYGVEELATANVKDFGGLGLRRVFNPLAP